MKSLAVASLLCLPIAQTTQTPRLPHPLTVLFGPIGLIKHGHNIEIKQGQALKAFVDDDVLLAPAA